MSAERITGGLLPERCGHCTAPFPGGTGRDHFTCTVNRKNHYLGLFDRIEDAAEARRMAEATLING